MRYRVRGLDWDGGGGVGVIWVATGQASGGRGPEAGGGPTEVWGERSAKGVKGVKTSTNGIQRLLRCAPQVVKLAIAQIIPIQY